MSSETPKSSNNEIHELRYRISQLEHLIVNASSSPSVLHNSSSLPSNSSLLNTPHGLVERVNELEGLLAASELDNRRFRNDMELMKADKNRQEVRLLEKLYKKDSELKDLQHGFNLLEVKYKKAQTKLENIQEYINELPCQEELDEAQSIISKLQEDNQLLDGKLSRMTEQISVLRRDVLDKERAVQDAQIKLEELKPLKVAQLEILKERDLQNIDLKNEKGVLELITVQRAQLIRSSKIVSTLRDKLSRLDEEKADAIIKISNQESDIESLQEQFLTTQLKMDRMDEKLKLLEQEKAKLLQEITTLRNQIEQRDCYLQKRDQQINNLLKLVTEIDLCVGEVEKLVELGQNIAAGEEPPVCTLLGLSDDLELHLRSLNLDEAEDNGERNGSGIEFRSFNEISVASGLVDHLEFDPSDTEWALDRLKKVRGIRKNLGGLRDLANDLYTDMLGGNVEGCKIQ